MNLLIIDVETTGLEPRNGNLIEIAGILYETDSRSVIHSCSTLIPSGSNNAYHINNISVESLQRTNFANTYYCINTIKQLMIDADAYVAHNASFDKKWLENYPPIENITTLRKWICTRKDIKWPPSANLKLQTIAKTMNVEYKNAHRALGDCFILLECLQKLENFDDQLNKLLV